MHILRAAWRFSLGAASIGLGAIVIVLLALIPVRRGGVRLPLLAATQLSKIFLGVFGVRIICDDAAQIRQHHGLIFCNHLSYLDIMVLLSVAPVRFLSARGVQRIPFVGWIATAIDTVFVNRGDQESRAAARKTVSDQLRERAYPPLVLFPEGQVGPGDQVLPFRRGAFEIAGAENIPYLLCALTYDPLPVANYYAADDTLPKAVWRLATHPGRVVANLAVLELQKPDHDFAPEIAAAQAHQLLQAAYADRAQSGARS